MSLKGQKLETYLLSVSTILAWLVLSITHSLGSCLNTITYKLFFRKKIRCMTRKKLQTLDLQAGSKKITYLSTSSKRLMNSWADIRSQTRGLAATSANLQTTLPWKSNGDVDMLKDSTEIYLEIYWYCSQCVLRKSDKMQLLFQELTHLGEKYSALFYLSKKKKKIRNSLTSPEEKLILVERSEPNRSVI